MAIGRPSNQRLPNHQLKGMLYIMELTIEQIARQYLSTRSAKESAERAMKELEGQLKSAMNGQGLKTLVVDNRKIHLVDADRRAFDASVLRNLVPSAIFGKITDVVVKTDLIDAAMALGEIDKDVVEQATRHTPYTQIRVN